MHIVSKRSEVWLSYRILKNPDKSEYIKVGKHFGLLIINKLLYLEPYEVSSCFVDDLMPEYPSDDGLIKYCNYSIITTIFPRILHLHLLISNGHVTRRVFGL